MLNNLYFSEHHLSHCSSAFFPSPFSNAGILTLDGIGEWATTTIAKGQDNHIEILQELHFPHSLGLLYSAFTYYLGFKVNSGEYKVMGLAPYGEPKFVDIIKTHLVDIKPDGSFSLNMKYFSYTYGLRMTNAKFDSLFHAQRSPESKLEQIHMDIAASLQVVTEEIMIALARTTARLSGSRNLVLSGGVALNCVGNGKIYQKLIKEEKILDHIWIQPASGDAGSAVGCGLAFYHIECKQPRLRDSASGEQCGSVADFVKGTTAKVANLPQNPQSSHSPTANLRIREEENQASLSSRADEVGVAIHKSTQVDSRGDYSAIAESMDCHATATAAARNDRRNATSQKVDSSNEAQNLANSAKDSRILESKDSNVFFQNADRRQDLGDRIVALQGESRAHTRAYVTADSPQQSAILAPKPTPEPSKAQARFHPPQWLNNFNAWMRDLRPWCISRQLWWGHRIPVWYCQNSACGHIFASKNESESTCPKCHSSVLQDPDVLDTWFSSGLWAFSTLGWGNGGACKEQYNAADLTRFYPNSLLITGFDILFFWVARMLFSGESLLGELPFRDVYLHALVRDEFGQKMSKSKGNVIDPLAMIEEFGADSLRFALAYSCAQGRDVRLAKSQLELAKNFANKLYNAAQFLLLYAKQQDGHFSGFTERTGLNAYRTPLGRYAKSRLNSATKDLKAALESYRFNDGASVAYRFLWGEFCDWCIELAKAQKESIAELGSVMIEAMKLLHPYMPFLTESLYHTLRGSELESSESIMITRYPSEVSQDSAIEQDYAHIKDAIVSLRRAKALIDLANKPIELAYIATDMPLNPAALQAICKLAKVGAIECVDTKARNGLDKDCVADIGSLVKSYLPLQGIDLAPIITRLNNQNLKLEKEITKLQALESNEKFKANAPKEVLESNATALAEAKAKQAEVLAQLAIFAQK